MNTFISGVMYASRVLNSVKLIASLNKVKASGGCHDFLKVTFRASSKKNRAQIRQGAFDLILSQY